MLCEWWLVVEEVNNVCVWWGVLWEVGDEWDGFVEGLEVGDGDVCGGGWCFFWGVLWWWSIWVGVGGWRGYVGW